MESEPFVVVTVVDPIFKASRDEGSTFLLSTINVTITIYDE